MNVVTSSQHTFRQGVNACLGCGMRAQYLPGMGAWVYSGPSTCPGAPATMAGPMPPAPCTCSAGGCGGMWMCSCTCHPRIPAAAPPTQLILPFDWDHDVKTPVTVPQPPKCPDCGREWVAALDEYHGGDPDLAERCAPCRSKLERRRARK